MTVLTDCIALHAACSCDMVLARHTDAISYAFSSSAGRPYFDTSSLTRGASFPAFLMAKSTHLLVTNLRLLHKSYLPPGRQASSV